MSDFGELEPDSPISDDWKRECVEVLVVFTLAFTGAWYIGYLTALEAVMFIPLGVLLYFSVDIYRYEREVRRRD